MEVTYVNPEELGPPVGFSHGIAVPQGKLLFVAGQIARAGGRSLAGQEFSEQFKGALESMLLVVEKAGGTPKNVVRLTLYVTDKEDYTRARKEIGGIYRELMGTHFPAMSLLEVKGLFEPGAKIELEATAVL